LSWVSATRSEIIEAIQARLATLTGEITRRQAIIQQQLASAAKHDERRQAVSRLKALAEAVSHGLTSLSPAAEPEPFDNPTAPGEMTAIEVPRFVEALARLTDRYVRQRFVVLRDSILARVGKRLRGAERRALLWSFEASSLERFLTRFWFDVLQGPLAPGSVLELIQDVGPFEAIGLGKEVADGDRQPSLMTEVKQFLSKASTVFLLLDAQWPILMKSQLARSEILPILRDAGGLVVVVQCPKELDVAESLYELTRMTTELGLRPDAYLANDNELMLSVLMDRLAMEGERLNTQRDEAQWLKEFEFFSREQRDRCAKILHGWWKILERARE